MDNPTLEKLITDPKERQFWVKPVGDPAHPPTPGLLYNESIRRIEFAKRPNAIKMDDILIVYAIGQSKILFVMDKYTHEKEATPQEIEKEPWRGRWRWSFKGHNYTQTYGTQWWHHQLNPFHLLQEFNLDNPTKKQSLGTLQHGQDKAKISRDFALCIINKILQL